MSSDKKIIAKTGLIGTINQALFAILGFISRKLFIIYIGTDILGLSGTYTSVLSTLALADLGFDIAVTYALYKPLNDGDEKRINDIMRALKTIYNVVGTAFVALSFLALPFLKFFITDMEFKDIYYLYFIMQAFASSASSSRECWKSSSERPASAPEVSRTPARTTGSFESSSCLLHISSAPKNAAMFSVSFLNLHIPEIHYPAFGMPFSGC